jgi:2'-5' RNA ligase
MAQTEYSFWLMPAEPLRNQLCAVIDALAVEFDAPRFAPHVTICHGPSSGKEASEIAGEIAAQFQPLDLEMRKLDQSAIYIKTFFVQFHESEPLRRMFELARERVAIPQEDSLNPHLSLLYQRLSEEQRHELCRRSLVPGGAYRLDGIRVVEYEPPWREQAIKRSRIIADLRLQNSDRSTAA